MATGAVDLRQMAGLAAPQRHPGLTGMAELKRLPREMIAGRHRVAVGAAIALVASRAAVRISYRRAAVGIFAPAGAVVLGTRLLVAAIAVFAAFSGQLGVAAGADPGVLFGGLLVAKAKGAGVAQRLVDH